MSNPLSTQEKLAIACAGIPLTVGTSIYLLWRLTFWRDLEWAGIWTIQTGILLFLIGGLLLLSELWLFKGSRRNRGRKFVIGILLLANFPIAGFLISSVFEVRTRYVIEVVNKTGHAVASFEVVSNEGQKKLGPIADGSSAKSYIHVSEDDCLSRTVTASSAEIRSIQSDPRAESCFNEMGNGISIELHPDKVVKISPIKK